MKKNPLWQILENIMGSEKNKWWQILLYNQIGQWQLCYLLLSPNVEGWQLRSIQWWAPMLGKKFDQALISTEVYIGIYIWINGHSELISKAIDVI